MSVSPVARTLADYKSRRKNYLDDFFKYDTSRSIPIVTVTAEQARWLLETSKGNRRLIKSNLVRLQQDMRDDNFYLGADALLFGVDDSLCNGHHRFTSQILVGVTLQYMVRTKVSRKEIAVIDHGSARNTQASIGYLDEYTSVYGELNGKEGAYIYAVLKEGGRKIVYPTTHKLGEALVFFKSALHWVFEILDRKNVVRITHAATIAPFIRAYHAGYDKDKLTIGLRYLIGGQGDDTLDMPEIMKIPGIKSIGILREHLLGMKSGAGAGATREMYNKVERMLIAFLKGQDIMKVHPAKEEQFPIDLSELLDSPVKLDEQYDILGPDLHQGLMQWADSAPTGTELKPDEVVESILVKSLIKLKSSTIANKLSKASRTLGCIKIPNKGELVAFGTHPNSQKVSYYEFRRTND